MGHDNFVGVTGRNYPRQQEELVLNAKFSCVKLGRASCWIRLLVEKLI